ncbi:hypothetical protein evm_006006 [Chilo suppressalis]|nr:hypothetical protein evm_006006 [Chilo suppressalis]
MSHKRNGLKRTHEDAALDSEAVIDSTAPIAHIVKEFLKREYHNKAYRFYHQLLGKRKALHSLDIHYTTPGHPLKYFKDDWDGNIGTDFFEQFQYKSTMPKVITEMKNVDKYDPVTDLMKIKSDWHHGNSVIKASACLVKAMRDKCEHQFNDEVMQVPQYLIDLATRLEKNPDPNFDASFNWYYAGNGNMQIICVNWVDYTLHSEFGTVYISKFDKDRIAQEMEISASFDCGKDNLIYETICSSQNIVAVRTKHTIFLLKIVEINNELCFEKLKHFETNSIYTGISFDSHHTYILYATTLDSKLTIVNINRMTGRSVKLKNNSDSLLNNWNCIIGAERCTYMHIEKGAITLYDKRTNSKVNIWTGVKDIVDTVHCNNISAAKHCKDSPSLYFATDHYAFLMDTRAAKSKNLRAVQRWTHGMKCAPTYMLINKAANNKELITLSSQWCEDTCVISNYANSVINSCEISGVTMPYHPPNILDVLNQARQNMQCIDLYRPIEERLSTSITGQAMTEIDDQFCILTQNSLGDVFARNLYPKYMESFIEDDSVQRLHDWSKSYKTDIKIFEVSALRNIANVWHKLKKVPDSYNFGPKNIKEYFDESKVFESFEKEELIPELLDAWCVERDAAQIAAADQTGNQSSIMSRLHFEDSDDE